MMVEHWKPIPGHPCYEASDLGRIRNVAPRAGTRPGKILTPGDGPRYSRVLLSEDNVRTSRTVHRLVALAWLGPPPSDDACVHHKNHNTRDNRACNLRWTTQTGNMSAAAAAGRISGTKLTPDDVRAIRAASEQGALGTELAEQYGVTPACICAVIKRRTWRHVA